MFATKVQKQGNIYILPNGKFNDVSETETTDNIVIFPVKNAKRNKDGSICRTHCNKQAGVSSSVYAFKTKEEINAMLDVFDRRICEAETEQKMQLAARNKLFFQLGINLGLRASDLRKLKFSFFFEEANNKPLLDKDGNFVFQRCYPFYPEKQKKQHKLVTLYFNTTVKQCLTQYLKVYPFNSLNDYLFPSQKPSQKKDKVEKNDTAILESTMWSIIKEVASEAGIKQNIGSHSLRKTWGFWVWHNAKDKNKQLVMLQYCFNHSSPQTTMKYIGLLDDEIKSVYESVELGNDSIVFC